VTPLQAKAMREQGGMAKAPYYVASPPNSGEFTPVVAISSTVISHVPEQPPPPLTQTPLQSVKLVSALPQAVMLMQQQEEDK
jgi:hypothetical protein